MHCFYIVEVTFNMPHNIFKTNLMWQSSHTAVSVIAANLKAVLSFAMLISLINSKQTLWTQHMFKMFHTIQKISRQYGDFPDKTETFQTLKFFKTIIHFQDNQEMFQTVQKLSRQYGNLLDNTETFQTIKQLAGQSGNGPDN